MGQPLVGWSQQDAPHPEKTPQPIARIKSYTGNWGKTASIFTTTMGHGDAFKIEVYRRMLSNACFWCMALSPRSALR
jgi:hypothetical protein